ncbi:hypothetical protein L6V77_23575 [Myxococcota bacterium]|nr:hypothetical protein [Myxococcota bacterium]
MRPHFVSFSFSLALACALPLFACDTDDDGGGNAGTDAGGSTVAGCEGFDCSGHGACVVVEGLPACDCDEGYVASGLDCVSATPTAPEPPAGFTCPAPGDAAGPLAGSRFYYATNDRACGAPGWKMLYAFRADGVFTIHSQFQAAVGADSGSFDYGCYTATAEPGAGPEGADVLRLDYAYTNESNRNCTMLGRLDDPPCEARLIAGDAGAFVQADSLAGGETHLFRPVADAACVWCSTTATCCPENGWVADASGPICP